jgi:hypothetical protein
MLRSWEAELAPFPNRWRRAARVAFVTAVGAGIMAAVQIVNPLGLTLLVSFAAPEFAFSLATAAVFLVAAAAIQVPALFVVGALADNPTLLVAAFAALSAISTYFIYGVRQLGRLWLWIQIPSLTAFYMVLFEHRTLGWDNAEMYAGTAIAIVLLWLFNNIIWPMPAEMALANSLRSTLTRSRRRLDLLVAIFLGETAPGQDRAVASKLAYHLALLRPASRQAEIMRASANLLAAVMVAERIHDEIDRLCMVAYRQAGSAYDAERKLDLRQLAESLGDGLDNYVIDLEQPTPREQAQATPELALFHARAQAMDENGHADEVAAHLTRIGDLLRTDPRELLYPSAGEGCYAPQRRPFRPNKFLVRFCVRHTAAMVLAFIAGLYDNNPAIHAALWLLMIGGPPSHGATARKFTMRAIGCAGALILAALSTIIVVPNFTSIPTYLAAIFIGVVLMTYVSEGGGELSYLGIGATAFVIAFSGPGPRPDMMGSIWTIWGIGLGMIIRAAISAISIERPNRTLAEEIERPLKGLALLASSTERNPAEVAEGDLEVITGIKDMLDVAADAQLQGPSSGIDARNLVDALDTMRRLAFSLANLDRHTPSTVEADEFDQAVRVRIDGWLNDIRQQLRPGRLEDAPLRAMVASGGTFPPLLGRSKEMPSDPNRAHIAELIQTLERELTTVRLA